jgi:DNA-directed RNA polymerase specialized sigma subunit
MTEETVSVTRTITVTKEEYSEVENYLRTYSFYKKLLKLEKYEQEYFERGGLPEINVWEDPSGNTVALAKMFEVRHFIMSMQNCDEKLMLYYLFVKGDSVERCAELMGISRSSAFRLKKRAMVLAAEYYAQKKRWEKK